MPVGNKVQRNFKKQMASVEKKMHREAKKGKGVFANNLFLLRFYGYGSTVKVYKSLPVKLFEFIGKFIKAIIKICLYILIFLGIAVVVVMIIKHK